MPKSENEGAIMIVGTEGAIGKEKEWHKWYDEKHIPMILTFPGCKRVKRYKKTVDNGKTSYPTYLAVYEFESAKAAEAYFKSKLREEVVADSASTWGQGGTRQSWWAQYECFKTFEK
ncbi:MAG: EthD family reductase [Chloroflexi bacterium]|nr:EthD family reductase [Chloroflexota bacterium]